MVEPNALSRPLRVMTYNVRYFGHGTRGLASTARSLYRIASAIADLKPAPDIVCLQEVETVSLRSTLMHPLSDVGETQLERLMTSLHLCVRDRGSPDVFDAQYFPAHDYRVTDRTSFYTTGLAIVLRRPLKFVRHNAERPQDITHRRAGAAPEDGSRGMKQTRICAHALVETATGTRFDLFNTHLSLPAFFDLDFWTQPYRMGWGKNQLAEVAQVRAFVEREKADGRFLVMGDFNALPGSPVYEFLTGECSWHDPLGASLGHDVERLRGHATAGFLRMRMHLDHLLSGPGVRWLDLEASRPFGDAQNPFHGLSDHVPIVGRFTVEGDGAIDAPSP